MRVDFEELEGGVSGGAIDVSVAAHLGVVADAAEQAVGNARSAAGAHGELGRAVAVDGHAEDVRGALDDEAQLVVGVELEPQQNAEAGAHGRAEQAGAGGGGDESEGLDVQNEGTSRGPLADHNVEFEIFKRGVKLFL